MQNSCVPNLAVNSTTTSSVISGHLHHVRSSIRQDRFNHGDGRFSTKSATDARRGPWCCWPFTSTNSRHRWRVKIRTETQRQPFVPGCQIVESALHEHLHPDAPSPLLTKSMASARAENRQRQSSRPFLITRTHTRTHTHTHAHTHMHAHWYTCQIQFKSNGVAFRYCRPKFNKSQDVIIKSWSRLIAGDISAKKLLKWCTRMNRPWLLVLFLLNHFIQLNCAILLMLSLLYYFSQL